MIRRRLIDVVPRLRKGYPAIAVTGPRQSGKTTLAKLACPDLPYVNFESPLERAEFARDPIGVLARFPRGAIFDEVQNVPDLLSYLQVRIDADQAMGQWILTGSQQLELGRSISQSLAGRVALLELLPLSYAETAEASVAPSTLAEAILTGGYPALYDPARTLETARWFEDYLATLINRDILQIIDVKNRSAFDRFVRLCAARTGQILNTSDLAGNCGVDHKTIASWLSVLEACYIIRLLRPHHRNFGKRLVKSPKLYFLDTGLVCRLLHIANVDQLEYHPHWGALVETWCVGEAIKARLHRGLRPEAWFWRSSDGIEIDLLFDVGGALHPFEIRAAMTIRPEDFKPMQKLRELSKKDPTTVIAPGTLIFGGGEARSFQEERCVPWNTLEVAIPEGLS